MYIAIILENFDEIFQQDESGVSRGDFETFYMVWGRYDPRATQFVTLTELSNLLHDLHPPFQLSKPNLVNKFLHFNFFVVNQNFCMYLFFVSMHCKVLQNKAQSNEFKVNAIF